MAVNMHRHAQHARVDERLKLTPCVPAEASAREPGAEHEQEQERLHQRGDDAQPVAAEADQLALPDDLDRAQLAAQAARRDADRATTLPAGGVAGGRGLEIGVGGAHRSAISGSSSVAMLRRVSRPAEASASRIVVPV